MKRTEPPDVDEEVNFFCCFWLSFTERQPKTTKKFQRMIFFLLRIGGKQKWDVTAVDEGNGYKRMVADFKRSRTDYSPDTLV